MARDSGDLGEVGRSRPILRFTLPSILMMISISSYVMVDGLIIANTLGTDALAACNLTMPLFSTFAAVGFMFATGGSALIGRKMGAGRGDEANSDFTLIVIVALAIGCIIGTAIGFNLNTFVHLLGADDTLSPMTSEYLWIQMLFAPALVLQFIFIQFLVVAGRPGLSFMTSVFSGIANIGLDLLFIVGFDWGIAGASLASGISYVVPSIVAIAVFRPHAHYNIRFGRPSRNLSVIGESSLNGLSEMVSELSGAISTLVLNLVMMHFVGPDGVSAITIILYVQFLALAVATGFSFGIAPVMSFNYGREDREMMSRLYRTSLTFILGFSVFVFAFMEIFGGLVVTLFDDGNSGVYDIATKGILIHSFAYIFMGFNMYASSLFTSLSNGVVSAVISACRVLVILVPLILLFAFAFGLDGVWFSIPVTELITAFIATAFLVRLSDRYGYGRLFRKGPKEVI